MIIIAPVLALGQDPRGYYLIHGAEEAMCCNGYGNVRPENARGLPFAQDPFYQIKVFPHQIVGELTQKFGTVPQLGLEHDGQVAIRPQPLQVQKCHPAELFAWVGEFVQCGLCSPYKAMEGGINRCHQELIFILEIKIDRAVGDPGTICYLGHARVKEAVLGNDLDCGIQNSLVLV